LVKNVIVFEENYQTLKGAYFNSKCTLIIIIKAYSFLVCP